ncbi:MAG: hypothetical protein DWP95_07655, partial [Proteobacteria bacterium]
MFRLIFLFVILPVTMPVFATQLPSGPMLGHVALRAANVWAQAPSAGTLGIEYWANNDRSNRKKMSAKVAN